MKNITVSLLVLAGAVAGATGYDFGTFSIQTGEELWLGAKYTGYPVNYLFDHNPKTAWVFKGKTDNEYFKQETSSVGNIYGLTISLDDKVAIDGLKIIGGYAKDEKTWRRNNRIKRLRIWDDNVYDPDGRLGLLADVKLPDKAEWKTIRFKKTLTSGIRLEPVEFYKGADGDVCISEMEVLSNGKPMEIDTRRMSLLNAGGGCCCSMSYYAVNRHGTRIAEFSTGEGNPNCEISEDGKYIAGGLVKNKHRVEILVIDADKEKVVRRKVVKVKEPQDLTMSWDGHKLMDGWRLDSERKLLIRMK